MLELNSLKFLSVGMISCLAFCNLAFAVAVGDRVKYKESSFLYAETYWGTAITKIPNLFEGSKIKYIYAPYPMDKPRSKVVAGIVVRLDGGEVRIYPEAQLEIRPKNSQVKNQEEPEFTHSVESEPQEVNEVSEYRSLIEKDSREVGGFLPLSSKTHQHILKFLADAHADPDRKDMGSEVYWNFKEKYLRTFPNISLRLADFEDEFILALDKIGIFQFRKGGDGGFDFDDFCYSITSYADYFASRPDLLDKVRSDSPYVASYRSIGQTAILWQLQSDLGDYKEEIESKNREQADEEGDNRR